MHSWNLFSSGTRWFVLSLSQLLLQFLWVPREFIIYSMIFQNTLYYSQDYWIHSYRTFINKLICWYGLSFVKYWGDWLVSIITLICTLPMLPWGHVWTTPTYSSTLSPTWQPLRGRTQIASSGYCVYIEFNSIAQLRHNALQISVLYCPHQ